MRYYSIVLRPIVSGRSHSLRRARESGRVGVGVEDESGKARELVPSIRS